MFEFVAMILIACILAIIRLLGKCNLQHYLQHLHGFLWRVRRPAVITDDRLGKKKKVEKLSVTVARRHYCTKVKLYVIWEISYMRHQKQLFRFLIE